MESDRLCVNFQETQETMPGFSYIFTLFGRLFWQSYARKLRFIKLACTANPQSLRSFGVAHVENPARGGRHGDTFRCYPGRKSKNL
jgi:hypothetical protein